MLWPVRWVNCGPKPAPVMTARAAASASQPATGLPAANASRTTAIAASRASRTMAKTVCSRSDGARPTVPVQVMSYQIEPGFASRPQMSTSKKSPSRIGFARSAAGS